MGWLQRLFGGRARGIDKELLKAAEEGDAATLRDLLQKGANPNAPVRDDKGTALMAAAYFGHADAASALVRNGANVDAKNWRGFTPLMYAASEGRAEIVRLLIASGADVNWRKQDGWTALMLAEGEDVVRMLKEAGARQ